MWLSGANAMFGATRTQMTAALQRQMNTAIAESTKQMLAFWGLNTPPRKRRPKRPRLSVRR
jgi:hypothetical protein